MHPQQGLRSRAGTTEVGAGTELIFKNLCCLGKFCHVYECFAICIRFVVNMNMHIAWNLVFMGTPFSILFGCEEAGELRQSLTM